MLACVLRLCLIVWARHSRPTHASDSAKGHSMHARWSFTLACIALAGCQSLPSTGLSGASSASVVSSGDPGIFQGLSTQGVVDQGVKLSSAIFRSTHLGATEDGFGTTDWTYVRVVELDHAAVVAGKHNLAPEVVKFFRDCAPQLDPAKPLDAIRSGVVSGTSNARLVLTRLDWRTEIGPGPNKWEAARIPRAALEVYGATASVHASLNLAVRVSATSIKSLGNATTLLESGVSGADLSQVRADCVSKVLKAPTIALGGTGWFPRGDVNNIQVEVIER